MDHIKTKNENKKFFSGKKMIWAGVFIVAILFVMAIVFIIKPKYELLISITEERKGAEANVAGRIFYEQSLEKLISDYGKIQKDFAEYADKINLILPKEKIHEQLLPAIESLVLKNGLLITNIGISAGEDSASEITGGVGEVIISLDLIGVDYGSLKNLLLTLETDLRLKDVTKISFSPDSNTASLELVTYYLK
jgi:hypothetical protein